MTELVANALTMVDSSTEDVRSAIVDYQDRRQLMLPDECESYEIVSDDSGVGTEVAMTLALYRVIRNRKGGRRKKKGPKGKQEALECLFRLEELSEDRIVERDTRSSMCNTWTLRPTGDDRTAVHVQISWEAPDGLGNFLRRQNEKLAMRMFYEDILTRLHELFVEDESATKDEHAEDAGTETQGAETQGAGTENHELEEPRDQEPRDQEPRDQESAKPQDKGGPGATEAGRDTTESAASPTNEVEPPAGTGGSTSGQS
jgi:hypothetical protein